jgi:hypothetical protein
LRWCYCNWLLVLSDYFVYKFQYLVFSDLGLCLGPLQLTVLFLNLCRNIYHDNRVATVNQSNSIISFSLKLLCIEQDLQLVIEIVIEVAFDIVRKALYFPLSPFKTCRLAFKRLITSIWVRKSCGMSVSDNDAYVQTSTLNDWDPSSSIRQTKFQQSLNTDARTCEDVITELGYCNIASYKMKILLAV